MATLPTVPTFTDGTAPSISNLNKLAYAVQFLSDLDVRPVWHCYKTGTVGLAANTASVLTFGQTAIDSDGVLSNGTATIKTQGYYAVEACIPIVTPSATIGLTMEFLFTAGGSNPHFTSGTTLLFGGRGDASVSDGTSDEAICISDICPNVLYPGDTLQVSALADTACTVNWNRNQTYISGRLSVQFTGMWVSTGT